MTEAELFEEIRKLLKLYKWRWYHNRDSRGSNAGYPDLVMVRGKRLLYRELKSEKGRLSKDQNDWLCALVGAGQDADVWRPHDLERIAETLCFMGG